MIRTGISIALLLVTIAGIGLLAGCEPRNNVSAASRGEGSDRDLESAVKAQLNTDPEVREAELIVVADARANEIRLSGAVPSEAVRVRAIELARTARPDLVLVVSDKIDIRPRNIQP